MKRCAKCGGRRLARVKTEERLKVGDITFSAEVEALKCPACDEVYLSGPMLESFELQVAGVLARTGKVASEEFSFMRRALGMTSTDLAALLDVTLETVSRWEHGHQPVERRAAALLAAMVLDQLDGRTTTRDSLGALLHPQASPKRVRLSA